MRLNEARGNGRIVTDAAVHILHARLPNVYFRGSSSPVYFSRPGGAVVASVCISVTATEWSPTRSGVHARCRRWLAAIQDIVVRIVKGERARLLDSRLRE